MQNISFLIFISFFILNIAHSKEEKNINLNNSSTKSDLSASDKIFSDSAKSTEKQNDNEISIIHESNETDVDINNVQLNKNINISIDTIKQKPDANTDLISAIKALRNGQIEVATYLYKKTLTKYPNNYDALFSLALIYQQNKQIDEARSLYTKLLNHYPDDFSALNNFISLSSEEFPIKTIEELKKIEKSKPDVSLIAAQIAKIYNSIDDYANAISYFNKAITLDPTNIDYRYNLAIIYDKFGFKSEAIILYKQVIKENFTNNNDNIINNITKRIEYLSNS